MKDTYTKINCISAYYQGTITPINGRVIALGSWVKDINIVKLSDLLKLIYRVNSISVTITTDSFIKIEKPNLKFMWNFKETSVAEMPQQKNKG